jgi:signal peptidase
MDLKRRTWQAIQGCVGIVVVALVVGQVLGQPLLLSYVTSGSMEPAITAGEGFVALPPMLAGSIESGDVVVFDADRIDGGGLTTHRVVDETDRGYITKGDANPFTDQDNGETPVQEAEVVAVAWRPTGSVLTIPHLGTGIESIQSVLEGIQNGLVDVFGTRALLGLQGIGYLLFALSVMLYFVLEWFEDDRQRDRDRDRSAGIDARVFALGLAVLVMGGATAAMVIPGGTQEYGIVSAEFESDNPATIKQNSNGDLPYTVGNGGFVATVVVLEPEGENITVEPNRLTVPGGETANASISISTPPETGYFQYFLTEHRYLQLLPASVILALHEIHPLVALLVINAEVGIPVYLLSIAAIGRGRIRSRDRNDPSRGSLLGLR